MRPAVFLDRDGVLIRSFLRDGVTYPPRSIDEVAILPGVAEGLDRLRALGLARVVVTNQPDVSRGKQTREQVEAINAHLAQRLPIDAIYVCYHDNADRCACRKPAAGMLLTAAQEHGLDLSRSFMVGDRATDIAAGHAAGCRTFLIESENVPVVAVKPTWKAADLMEVARRISAES